MYQPSYLKIVWKEKVNQGAGWWGLVIELKRIGFPGELKPYECNFWVIET